MFGRKNKPIFLTESAILSLEMLKRAIQIWFGREVTFVQSEILLGQIDKVRGTKGDSDTETCTVNIDATFHFTDCNYSELATKVSAEVKLRRVVTSMVPSHWLVDGMRFGLGREQLTSWYLVFALCKGGEMFPELTVKTETVDRQAYKECFGRSIADRQEARLS